MIQAISAQQKIKSYLKVFYILIALTVVELAVVALKFLPPTMITGLVVILSLAKAYLVGWYYMHLNHERAWTRVIAAFPLVMVLVAGILVLDQKIRPLSNYIGAPARVHDTPVYPKSAKTEEGSVAESGSNDEGDDLNVLLEADEELLDDEFLDEGFILDESAPEEPAAAEDEPVNEWF